MVWTRVAVQIADRQSARRAVVFVDPVNAILSMHKQFQRDGFNEHVRFEFAECKEGVEVRLLLFPLRRCNIGQKRVRRQRKEQNRKSSNPNAKQARTNSGIWLKKLNF